VPTSRELVLHGARIGSVQPIAPHSIVTNHSASTGSTVLNPDALQLVSIHGSRLIDAQVYHEHHHYDFSQGLYLHLTTMP
jgi:hypothetical protein